LSQSVSQLIIIMSAVGGCVPCRSSNSTHDWQHSTITYR